MNRLKFMCFFICFFLAMSQFQAEGFETAQNQAASTSPYYIRLYNIDDEAVAYVNGQIAAKTGYGGESGWVDISPYVKPGSNTVRFVLHNNSGGWSYGFGLARDEQFIWKDECGRAGSMSCNNNAQTGIVFDKSVDFLYGNNSTGYDPQSTISPGGGSIYRDTHLGWAGINPSKNQYYFDVTEYAPGSRWFLSGTAIISGCGNTSGIVLMKKENQQAQLAGKWGSHNLSCFDKADQPGNPDNGLTRQLADYIRRKNSANLTIDVSHIVNGNGRYMAEWRYDSGCCGVFMTEMRLRGEW